MDRHTRRVIIVLFKVIFFSNIGHFHVKAMISRALVHGLLFALSYHGNTWIIVVRFIPNLKIRGYYVFAIAAAHCGCVCYNYDTNYPITVKVYTVIGQFPTSKYGQGGHFENNIYKNLRIDLKLWEINTKVTILDSKDFCISQTVSAKG